MYCTIETFCYIALHREIESPIINLNNLLFYDCMDSNRLHFDYRVYK